MQSRYLHSLKFSYISIILSRIAILGISDKSIAENPGVSTTKPPSILYNSTCLVVCFPLPNALEISPVSKLRVLSNLLIKVLFPAPL